MLALPPLKQRTAVALLLLLLAVLLLVLLLVLLAVLAVGVGVVLAQIYRGEIAIGRSPPR